MAMEALNSLFAIDACHSVTWEGRARASMRNAMTRNAIPGWRRHNPRAWRKAAQHAAVAAAAFLAIGFEAARAEQIGSASGLPIPRYVSLKSDRVNLREGPSKDHRTIWVFQRAGLPVEITAEFEIWRKVRDSEGAEGWVLHSLLSGRRTGLVTPWKKGVNAILYSKPGLTSAPAAKLQPNVLVNVRSCDGSWCRVWGAGFDGFLEQSNLWGVYPGEKIE
jgi:SH3-like domain-containing protein